MLNFLAHYPWSITFVSVFILVGLWTNSHTTVLNSKHKQKLGFASNHFFEWKLFRLITSVFVTHGRQVFWRGLFVATLINILAESMYGSLQAFLLFFGIHLAIVIVMSIFLAAFQKLHIKIKTLYETVDVGPSAGYFGLLGFMIVQESFWGGIGILFLLFLWALQNHITKKSFLPEDTLADWAHFLAFGTGCILSFY